MAVEVVKSVRVEGFTGRTYLFRKIGKVDITRGSDGVLHDDTDFAAEIGAMIPEPRIVPADTYLPLPFVKS